VTHLPPSLLSLVSTLSLTELLGLLMPPTFSKKEKGTKIFKYKTMKL
jgi:hypothetical protein